MPGLVCRQAGELLNAGVGDAVALFECKAMAGRFQSDIWSPLYIFRLNVGLEVEGLGIAWKSVCKPAEVRRLVDDFGIVPKLYQAIKILTAQRRPNAPHEELVRFNDWDRDYSADEEVAIVDAAKIGSEFSATVSLSFWDLVPIEWSIEADIQRKALVILTASSASKTGGTLM